MSKKTISVAISLLCIISIVLLQFTNIISFADKPSAKAPVLWYEDDFESENPAKITLDNNAKTESEGGRISVGVSTEEGSNNKVLEVVKKDLPANTNVNTQRINVYPQKPDGSYGLVNDGVLESGKTYRYIVTYDYKVADLSGSNGMYVFTSVAQKGTSFTNDKKNTQGYCLASNYLYTQDIGDYGLFNLVAPLGEWQTVSTATYCSTASGILDPAIIMQFELWRDFIGTVYFDNIRVYKVDENADVATVIFDANDNGVTRLNPVTYVQGALYNLPVPTKKGFNFLGWYADSEFTELCDNTLPKNKVNGKYTVLYARWNQKTLTDDFDQLNSKNRSLALNLSLENSTGYKSTSALKYSAVLPANSIYIPIDLKGNKFNLNASSNQTIQYIVEFDYKAPNSISQTGVNISFDLVSASDNKSISTLNNASFCVSPTVGNADNSWHKASFALRFTPNKSVSAAVALIFNSTENAEILIDNLSFQKMSGRMGSFVFERDEFIEYIDPVAGEYGDLSGVSLLATRKGYVFDGWYSGEEKISVDTFDAKDYVLFPKWEKLVAPEKTTEVFVDDFDGETPINHNIYDDVVVGPDTSGDDYYTDDFEQYNGDDIDINDNYKKDGRPAGLFLTTEKEADGNTYFRFRNTDNVLYRQNLIFRNQNGDPLYNKSLSKTKKYTVIYKLRYRVNAAPGDGMWMTSVLCDANTNDASGKSKCFIIAENKTAGSSYFYGNTDGNWHTVSFASTFQPTSDNPVTPGFFLEFGSQYGIRKVDICFDDISIKVIEGQNKAINYACSATPKSGQPGPTLEAIDVLAAEVDTHINFPNPYSDEYKFVSWTNTLGKAVTTAPKTSNGSTVTVYPKWESLEGGAPVSASVVQYKIMNGFGTGGTKTLKLYSASAGQGSINLKNASGNTYLKDLAANKKINLIVRFRYKATDPGNGVKMSFDIAAPGSDESLSVEKGTSSNITFGGINTNKDSLWHTASLPVSLTRNGDSPDVDVTLKINFLASSSFGGIYLDDFCVFDAGESPVSMFEFINKDFVDPVAGVVGAKTVLPKNPVALRSVGGWYSDSTLKQIFGASGETKAFLTEYKTLYGESLTYDGFFATERFDNSTKIYVDRMTSSSSLQYLWDRYGLYGKMRIFNITEEACHDENGIGYALKFDSRAEKYTSDPAASILLTNGINEQIKLGNTHDEEEKMYIVKYWYKIAETSTDLTFSVSACNYNSHWEGLNCENEVYQYPVLNESDGKWHQMTMLLGLAGDTEKKDIYLRFSVTGQALIYFDDFEVTQVKSGRGQTILFDTNGGNFIEPYVGEEGDPIPPLPTPKKDNAVFKGWYTDYGFTTPFTQQKYGHSNIYLNALWEETDDTSGKNNNSDANYGVYIDSTGCQKLTYFIIDKPISGIEYGQYTVSFDCLTVKYDSGSKIQPAIYGASGESVSSGSISDFAELEWQSYTLPISNDKKGTNLKFYLGTGFEGYIDNVVLKDSSGKVVARFDFDSDRDISIILEDESGLSAYIKECPTVGEDYSDIDLDLLGSDDSETLYEDILEQYPVKYNKKKTVIQKVRVYDGISPLWIVLIVAGSIVVTAGIAILLIILIKKKKSSKKAGV